VHLTVTFKAVCKACVIRENTWDELIRHLAIFGKSSRGQIFGGFLDLVNFNTSAVIMDYLQLKEMKLALVYHNFRVPTHPRKSWIFFLDFPGPGKSGKISLVLESPGNESLRSWKVLENENPV